MDDEDEGWEAAYWQNARPMRFPPPRWWGRGLALEVGSRVFVKMVIDARVKTR